MAVSIVGVTEGNVQPGTSIVITKPVGTTQNDLLVWAATTQPSDTITPTSGATLKFGPTSDSGGQYKLETYTQVAGASEPATYTWGNSSSWWWAVGLIVLRGASVPTLSAAQSNGNVATIDWATLTIPASGGIDLLLAAISGTFGAITPPANYTDATSNVNWPLIETRLNPPTGATGVLSGSVASGSALTSTHHVFVPASGGGGGDVTPTIRAGIPMSGQALVLSTGTGGAAVGGFSRTAGKGLAATTTTTGMTWQGGLRRGPKSAGHPLGPLVYDTAGAVAYRQAGLPRTANGALAVSTDATGATKIGGGLYRNSSGRLIVALNTG
jgi:hypothetical protein